MCIRDSVAGPLMQILIAKYGLIENFVILACIYAVVMTASALYLEDVYKRQPHRGRCRTK